MMERGRYAGNARIATTLLQVLGPEGGGARARVLRVVKGDLVALRGVDGWLDPSLLVRIFDEAGVDRRLARQVGHELVAPSRVGLFLTYAGVATLEKAYRQVDRLLPREQRGARYLTQEIEEGRARIEFTRPSGGGELESSPEVLCGVREGMLQALPLAYGLLPGRVRETSCVHRGGKACVYEVAWTRAPRAGLVSGLLVGSCTGSGLAFSLAHVPVLLALVSFAPALLALTLVFGCTVVGAAVGRSVDLARQLDAVAGARRGQLALLDQADRALAEKMDDLAKLDASLEATAPAPQAATSSSLRELVTSVDEIREHAAVVHRGLGELAQRFVERRKWTREQLGQDLRSWVSSSRKLEAALAGLREEIAPSVDGPCPRDLRAIARRVGEAVRDDLAQGQTLELDLDETPPVECDAFQIEQVIEQLLRNARAATESGGHIRVGLRSESGGVELVVADDGMGMDNEQLEQVFDPFFAPVAGVDTPGLGLAVCYRIVGNLGGELRIASTVGEGTRVTVLLPSAH